MGVLIALTAALALAACYTPELRDCTVSCDGPMQCASGQVCGTDQLCAAPEIAGRCRELAVDAGQVDARPDGPPTAALHVQVMGKGTVVVENRGTCSSGEPQRGDCVYDIALGIDQTVRAQQLQLDQVFLGWASETCRDEPAICTFPMIEPTMLVAKFGKPPGS